MATAIDWTAIQNRFHILFTVLGPLQVPSPEDSERLKLSQLTYGQISCEILEMIDAGYRLQADDEETRLLLEEVMNALGFVQGEQLRISPFDVVRRGIAERVIDSEFILAWGTLEYCWGVLRTLQLRENEGASEVSRRTKGALESTIVHEHWYAHWISAHAPSLEPSRRSDATADLAALCMEIAEGQRVPSPPYPKKWFRRMLELDERETPTGDLKSTYIRLSNRKIREMLKHPHLTISVLPPLHSEAFRRIGGNEP